MDENTLNSILNIDSNKRFVRKYMGIIALLVSIVIASLFFAFNLTTSGTFTQQFQDQGRAFFTEIVATRAWIAKHGGVYVPLDKANGINKYLEEIEGLRTIIELDGRKYTLKNPALVTRELSESLLHGDRLEYKITSTILMNPNNAPDAFEKKALEGFAKGEKEASAFERRGDKTYFRYMAPLITEKSCLECHLKQGYKPGDIRGGIAVSILADDALNKIERSRIYMVLAGIGVLALVIASIAYISRHFISDLQKAQKNLARMAMTDFLTGLYNRLTGMRMLRQELARSTREEGPLSIAILDIDHFKKVNDTYGHSAGDAVLISLANMLREQVREYDLACRYGGEEFLLVLPRTDLETARTILDRLLARIRETPVAANGTSITITFSAGVAQSAPDESVDALVGRADTLLYKAKDQGRNRVLAE